MKAVTHEIKQPKDTAALATTASQPISEQTHQSIAPALLMGAPLTSGTHSEGINGQDEAFWLSISSHMLEQAFQVMLDWLWTAIKDRYAKEIEFLSDATELSEAVLDPTLSMIDKCARIVAFLDIQKNKIPQIKDEIAVVQILLRIVTDLGRAGSTVLKRSVLTVEHLEDLLNNPAVQALADHSSISPLQSLIASLKDWALWIERLSKVSWQSPEAIVKDLVEGSFLPDWMNNFVVQGQSLYAQLQNYFESSAAPTDHTHSETQRRLKHHLIQFKEADGVETKFAILMSVLADDQALALIEQYMPSALQGLFKVYAMVQPAQFKTGRPEEGENDHSGLRKALLSIDHFTSQVFVDQLKSEGGVLGESVAEPLTKIRAVLRGSASQEAGFNMLLRLTDPQISWLDFAENSALELLALPSASDVLVGMISNMVGQLKIARALSNVPDHQLWEEFKASDWHQLPVLIAGAIQRDLQKKPSQLALALNTAADLPEGLIQQVIDQVTRIALSWKDDDWAAFISETQLAMTSLIKVLHQSGRFLPNKVQKAVDIGLWLARMISHLMMFRTMWNLRSGKQVLGQMAIEEIRHHVNSFAGDRALWAFDQALPWLPLMPPLYTLLKTLPPIEPGQQVKWVINLLIRLYSLRAMESGEAIDLCEKVERVAQQWLADIPVEMLGPAVITELKSQPNALVKAFFTGLRMAEATATYISPFIGSVTRSLHNSMRGGMGEMRLTPAQQLLFLGVGAASIGTVGAAPLVGAVTATGLTIGAAATVSVAGAIYGLAAGSNVQPSKVTPIAWSASASSSIGLGILFAWKAHQSRKQRLEATPDEEAYSAVNSNEHYKADSTIDLGNEESDRENIALNTNLSKPSKQHERPAPMLHPAIYGTLSAVFFAGSLYAIWSAYKASHKNNRVLEQLDKLLTQTKESIFSDNKEQIIKHIGEFLQLTHDLNAVTSQPADSGQSPDNTSERLTKRDATHLTASNDPGDIHELSFNSDELMTEALYTSSDEQDEDVGESQLAEEDEGIEEEQEDQILPLMREILELEVNLNYLRAEGKPVKSLRVLRTRLDILSKQLANTQALMKSAVHESNKRLTVTNVYAYTLLHEMKNFYPSTIANIWSQFDPRAPIPFSFTSQDGKILATQVPLVNFLNGGIDKRLIELKGRRPITFSSRYANTEVAQELLEGLKDYVPGKWTKDKTLNKVMAQKDVTAKTPPPTTGDRLSIRINKEGAEPESIALSLDMYIRQLYTRKDASYTSDDITWPSHYPEEWKKEFAKPSFKKAYMAGVTSMKQWNARKEDEDTLTLQFIKALWQESTMASKIGNHPQLKLMSLDSIISLEATNSEGAKKLTHMSLINFFIEQSERSSQTTHATISDPAGLLITDSLLREFIQECEHARLKIIQILQLEKARQTLNVPTTEGLLQEGLDAAVKKHSPGTAYPGKLQLKDTIKVKFSMNYKDFLNATPLVIPRIIQEITTSPTEPEVKEFTLSQIMSKLALRYGDTKGFLYIQYDIERKFPREIIRFLHSEDWQVNLTGQLEAYKADDVQKQAWATIFSPRLDAKIPQAYKNSPITSIKYNARPLPGVFKIRTGRTSFQLRSIFSPTYFEFNDRSQMRRAHDLRPRRSNEPRRQHEDFLPWLREHQGTYFNDNYGRSASDIVGKGLGANSTTYENFHSDKYPQDDVTLDTPVLMSKLMFDHLVTQLISDVDVFIKSDVEVFVHKIFQFMTDLGLYIGLALLPLSGPIALLLSAGLAALPFLEATVADTQEEARSIFMTSLVNALVDYTWGGIGDVPGVKTALVGHLAKSQAYLAPGSKDILKQLSRKFMLLNTPGGSAAYKEPWDYVAGRLVKLGYKPTKTLRIKGALEQAYKSPINADNTAILETFLDVIYLKVIFSELFMVRKGELITIMTQNTLPDTGSHLKHVLVSLGEGRFQGIGNNVLHPNLDPAPSILTADDLVKLSEGTLFSDVPDPDRQPLFFAKGTIKDQPDPPENNSVPTTTEASTTAQTYDAPRQVPDVIQQTIPGPYLKDPWHKRKLWSNRYVLEHFIETHSPGYLRLKNTHLEAFTMTLSSQQQLTIDWWLKPSSLAADQEHHSPALESSGKFNATAFELALSTYDRIVPLLLKDPQATYELYTHQLNQSGSLVDEDFLFRNEGFSFQPKYLTLSDYGALGDSFLVNLSASDINKYFTHYLTVKDIQGRVNINALGLLDYLLTVQFQMDPTPWPAIITREYLEERFEGLTYSLILADILTEFLTLNFDLGSSPQTDTQFLVSASGISAFLKYLASETSYILIQPLNMSRYSQDHPQSQFDADLSSLKNKVHANLATWIAIIGYAGGLPEGIMPSAQPLNNATYSDASTPQAFQLIGSITIPEDQIVPIGQNVNIYINDGTTKTHTHTITLPAGFTSPAMAAYYIADAINRDMSKLKMPLSNELEFTVVAGDLITFSGSNSSNTSYYVRATPKKQIYIHSNLNMLGIPRTFQVLVELGDDDDFDPYEYAMSHIESLQSQ